MARYAPETVSRLPAVLDQIDLIDLDPHVRILAQTVQPVTARSPDAVHLGTALHSRPQLTSFVTYDKRLIDAAEAAGLPVDSPSAYSELTATAAEATGPRSARPTSPGPGRRVSRDLVSPEASPDARAKPCRFVSRSQ